MMTFDKLTFKSLTRHLGAVSPVDRMAFLFKEPDHIVYEKNNRRELLQLLELEEHQLSDLGLTRADVRHVLRLPLSKSAARELNAIRANSKRI